MTSRSYLTRQGFLKIATNFLFGLSGLLGLGGLVRFFSCQLDPGAPTEFDLGVATNFPDGSRTIRTDIPAVIYNRAGEYTAYSLSCTHLGCTVELDSAAPEAIQGFTCPCHGSQYDAKGEVLKGPAQKPLRKLRVELQADNTLKLYTDRGQP